MSHKSVVWKFLYAMRDLRSEEVFKSLKQYCTGDVLDIGGWDFYLAVKNKNLHYKTWTTLEVNKNRALTINDEQFKLVIGDGCNMPFDDNSFDFILNLQVLEHVYEPIKMVCESARVLKTGSYGVFLIPQTSILHLAPDHYYNFTKFWIYESMKIAGFEIVIPNPRIKLTPI